MPLNPNAPAFSFNPNASEFVPNFGGGGDDAPEPSHAATNGAAAAAAQPSAEPAKHILHKDAPVFVPGGAASAEAKPDAKHAKDGKHHHHHDKHHGKHSKAPAAPVATSARPGAKYAITALLEMRTQASEFGGARPCMQDLQKTLADTPELDPGKEMPSRQQLQADSSARGKGGPPGPGTPKKGGRGGGKNDIPLRDKTGKIIEVKALEFTENRWKPSKPTDEEEKVYKTAKGIMNKLTLEKFEKLYAELLNVGITSASLLRGFVVLVYDKAVLEPTFINMYAKMCVRLAQDLPEFSDDDGVLPFGDVLVGKCRSEFATMGEEPPAEELAKLEPDEREGKLRKIRQRMLGNVEFIGELFKVELVEVQDVSMCMDKLLEAIKTNQEQIQPLCKLLEGVGKLLEEKDKEAVDSYFAALNELADGGTLNSRFKFMIMDLIDVRSKGWKARREVAGPKMLEEIQKEVDKENRYTEKKKDPNADKKKEEERRKKKEVSKRPVKKEAKVEDDGWSQVAPVKAGRHAPKGGRKSDEVMSSPIGAAAKAGAKGGKAAISMVRVGFAALMGDSEEGSGADSEEESGSGSSSEEEEEERPAKVTHGPELNEEARNKVGFIIEEFMCIHDVEEAVQCMVELHETAKYSKAVLDEEVVRRGLCMALEESPKECKLMASMYAKLMERDILLPEDASRGFCDLLEDLADIAIDIPKAPELLAAIAKDMLEHQHLSKALISTGVKALQESQPSIGKHFDEVLSITSS
mmetsp:Transcript_6347/g.16018  ORF Transcript_6347/g.16018 Transcript_6347/m.16018 type:complete len:752 (+) Transcript_6347:415-2670(+)